MHDWITMWKLLLHQVGTGGSFCAQKFLLIFIQMQKPFSLRFFTRHCLQNCFFFVCNSEGVCFVAVLSMLKNTTFGDFIAFVHCFLQKTHLNFPHHTFSTTTALKSNGSVVCCSCHSLFVITHHRFLCL